MKRLARFGHGITVAAIVALGILLAWPASAGQVTLQVSSTVPEWFEQERAIWDLYEDENSNIKIDLFPINEDTEAAYQARVAAGDPADIRVSVFPNLDNYKTYYDMRKLNYAYWNKLSYEGKTIFEQSFGAPYQPSLNVKSGHFFSFIFHADGIRKAVLDPKKNVRSLQDLEKFLD